MNRPRSALLAALAVASITLLSACYKDVDMIHGDTTKNYDVDPNKDAPDHPVTIVFFGPGASVGNVKDLLENYSFDTQGADTASMNLEF